MNKEELTLGEEIANAITHGIGALLALAGLVLLVVFSSFRGTAWHIVSFSIFGASLFIMYINSTLYHAFPKGKTKHIFEILDHSSIYILIAGTYTVYTFTALRGTLGWVIFGIEWGLVVFGVLFKVFLVGKYKKLSTLIYVLMGWVIVIDFKKLTENLTHASLVFLVLGGVLYTLGTIFYLKRLFKYHHAIWHIFVLGGSIMHFFSAIYMLPDMIR